MARKVVGVGSVGTRAFGKGDAFDRAILEFAEVYADQNERDHQALRAAVKAGKVKAQTGH